MDGKYMYEFIRDNHPNTLGSLVIEYIEKLRDENNNK